MKISPAAHAPRFPVSYQTVRAEAAPADSGGRSGRDTEKAQTSADSIRSVKKEESGGLDAQQTKYLRQAKQAAQVQSVVAQLKSTDTRVRAHEAAHMGAGGGLITSGASFTYQKGPDGRNYAVGGEVGIDTSAVAGDPEATIAKMQQVRAAALAPAKPSAQDLAVAAAASVTAAQAQAELAAGSGAAE